MIKQLKRKRFKFFIFDSTSLMTGNRRRIGIGYTTNNLEQSETIGQINITKL